MSECKSLKENIHVSKFEGLTLSEYVRARTLVCGSSHEKAASCVCDGMLKVAKEVIIRGYIPLQRAFNIWSPNVKYSSFQAKRNLLQIPVATVGGVKKREHFVFIYLQNVNQLLALAETESERERLKYAVLKSALRYQSKEFVWLQ